MPSETWPDERWNELAEMLRPLPEQIARVAQAVEHLTDETRALRDDFKSMREDLSASQRQIGHIGWALAFALLGAVAALIIALVA